MTVERKVIFLCLIIIAMVFSLLDGAVAEDLTPDKAKDLITNRLGMTRFLRHIEGLGQIYEIDIKKDRLDRYRILEEKGFIVIKNLHEKEGGNRKNERYALEFTDKASPYINKDEEKGDGVSIHLANVERLDVLDLKRLSLNEFRAEVFVGYRLTPFGEILLGRGIDLQRKEDIHLQATDNGWRLRFRTSF